MLILLISLLISVNCGAVSLKLRYERDQFATETLPDGTVRVTTGSLRSYPVNYGEPALPWIYMTVDIPVDTDFSDLKLTVSDRELILSDITMETLQYPVTTDVTAEELKSFTPVRYSVGPVYPSENVRYVRTREYDGRKEVCLLVSPLSLNSADGTLWINKGMDVELTTKPAKDSAKSPAQMKMAVSSTSRNLILSQLRYDLERNNKDKRLDYLIITVDSLANAFEPLLSWKRKKGLNADLLTLNTIYSAFSTEKTPQLKIKRCIQMLKEDYGLKYVLLGGDGYIVPVQCCYGWVNCVNYGICESYTIQTDLFYSCFKGSYDWNANGNDKFGEYDDNVIIDPEILVSRLPLHIFNDFENYITKLISYEENGNYSNWSNAILFAGSKLFSSDQNNSPDSYYVSQLKYNEAIKPYWQGSRRSIFSNPNDAFNGKKGEVTSALMQNELNRKYLLVDVYCHGASSGWQLDYEWFTTSDILNISNQHYHGLISGACHTNYYGIPLKQTKQIVGGITDAYQLSLAEGFLKSPKTGTISYLGHTREGLGSPVINTLGADDDFEIEVYKNLFSKRYARFSECLNEAREYYNPAFDFEDSHHWEMYSLNFSGDPETVYYIERPHVFDNISILTNSSGQMEIRKLPEDSNVKIGRKNDYGFYNYMDPRLKHPINLPNGVVMDEFTDNVVSVSITGNTYLPLQTIYSRHTYWLNGITYLQNFRTTVDNSFVGKTIMVGSNVCDSDEINEGEVIIQSGHTVIKGESVTLTPGFEVKKGAELTIQPMLFD